MRMAQAKPPAGSKGFTRVVMWLIPYLTTTGFFLSELSDFFSRASASESNRCFLAALSSGLRPQTSTAYITICRHFLRLHYSSTPW